MQTEAEGFLTRIRANPDDDGPRLVFADWLDEQGDPRGAFIRVQLALAQLEQEEAAAGTENLGRTDRDHTRARLQLDEQELRDAHEKEWKAPFNGLAYSPDFRRGFVEEVKVDARVFVHRAPELFDAAPLRHVHLLNLGGSLTAALQVPLLSRLAALTIHASYAGEPLARAVASCEHLAGLKRLHLSRNRFDDRAAELLATCPTLAGLEELDLAGNELGESGARSLAASPHIGSVRYLELQGNRLGPGGAEVLASSERLANLRRLGLAENDIGASRLQSTSRMHELLRVPILDLSTNGLTAAGLQVILTRPPGPSEPGAVRLQDLDLSHNELGDAGARVLASCPQLDGLRALRLARCALGDDGARALAESPHLNKLVTLDLSNNPINDAGFREYLNPSHLRNLRQLVYPRGLSSRTYADLDQRFHRR